MLLVRACVCVQVRARCAVGKQLDGKQTRARARGLHSHLLANRRPEARLHSPPIKFIAQQQQRRRLRTN